jgi:tRNA(fMet)-specific endonuclease VapC
MNKRSSAVRVRLDQALAGGSEIFASAVVTFELWYLVYRSAREEANAKRVEAFFAGPIRVLPFEEEDARSAGKIRAALETAGKTIGAYDTMIAGWGPQKQADSHHSEHPGIRTNRGLGLGRLG